MCGVRRILCSSNRSLSLFPMHIDTGWQLDRKHEKHQHFEAQSFFQNMPMMQAGPSWCQLFILCARGRGALTQNHAIYACRLAQARGTGLPHAAQALLPCGSSLQAQPPCMSLRACA